MDLNHRPHAYQACALNQLSYRPGLIVYSDPPTIVSKNRRRSTSSTRLGPWKLNSKPNEEMRVLRSSSRLPEALTSFGADLGLVA